MTPEQEHALILAEPLVDEAVRYAVEQYLTVTAWATGHADQVGVDVLTDAYVVATLRRRGVLEAWLRT